MKKQLWDLFCLGSIVGIWPRFLEPKLLTVKRLDIKLKGLKRPLKISLFSDLHIDEETSEPFLQKLQKAALKFEPDLIVCLGDFLCEGNLYAPKLSSFLHSFPSHIPAYCVLGNHDYEKTVSVNSQGDYCVSPLRSTFHKAFERLTKNIRLTGRFTPEVKEIPPHKELLKHLLASPFQLLDNKTSQVVVNGQKIQLTGLGEYLLDRSDPDKAFQGVDPQLPGLILAHNPDLIPRLLPYPGDLILCGHTHGGQINLPWFWKRLTLMENPRFKSGFHQEGDKSIYITRGVGSTPPFRFNAPPELTCLTCEGV